MKAKTYSSVNQAAVMATVLAIIAPGLFSPSPAQAVGFWTKLNNPAPGNVCLMLLLSDGRVMAFNNPQGTIGGTPDGIGKGFWFLNPDSNGNYVDGTWTSPSSQMNDSRLWYASQVLTNGDVFVAGGEYGKLSAGPVGNPVPGDGYARAELYDPVGDFWTEVSPPTSLLNPSAVCPFLAPTDSDVDQGFSDNISEILPNGNILIPPVAGSSCGETLIFNPANNNWSLGPSLLNACDEDEASFVKLPDGSILTIDPFGTASERYIQSLNQWVEEPNVPVQMYDTAGDELGAGLLMANGKAIFFGGTINTAIYTPSGTTSPGTWAAGPTIPQDPQGNPLTAEDLPAAMMVNGKILCVFGHMEAQSGGSPPPVFFFEFDPVANTFTEVNSPTGGLSDNGSSFTDFFGDNVNSVMLDLPNGQVLYSHQGGDLYVFTPDGSPLASGMPVIQSVGYASDGSLLLTGTLFNGISEGAAFGDDAQMNSNYPLVRATDAHGNVFYARTHNWSSAGVQTGNQVVTTECDLDFEQPGQYSIQVVANGIASQPWTYKAPDVWVDFTDYFSADFGNYLNPFQTLAEGISVVPSGGTIAIKGPSLDYSGGPDVSSETMTISTPMTIAAVGGSVTIGSQQ